MLEFLGFFVNQTVNMLELLGVFVNHTVKMLELLGFVTMLGLRHAHGFFATCTVKMLEILIFFVTSGCPSGQWPIATDRSDWWPS